MSSKYVQIGFILVTYLGLYSLALPVLAHSSLWLWLVSISDEGSLHEIALSSASKLASKYFSLFYRSVLVIYTEIPYSSMNIGSLVIGVSYVPSMLTIVRAFLLVKGKYDEKDLGLVKLLV